MRIPKRCQRAAKYLWREWIKPLGLAAIILFPLRSAVADWNWVPSGSMKPTILEGDLVFVNKLAYDLKVPFTLWRMARWDNPQRGDIVVFFSPKDGVRLVKRVIAVPGDVVEIRAEIADRGNGFPQCATDTCGPPDCLQRQTWTVEVR